MKKLILILSLAFCVSAFAEIKWNTDFMKALKTAKEENKAVFAYFSGSDWCMYCIKLHNEVLNKPAFEKFAEKELVPVLIDFPQEKKLPPKQAKMNESLARIYRVSAFPTALILNSKGKILLRTGYTRQTPEEYIKTIKAVIPKKK